jgi:hypothetical protein
MAHCPWLSAMRSITPDKLQHSGEISIIVGLLVYLLDYGFLPVVVPCVLGIVLLVSSWLLRRRRSD